MNALRLTGMLLLLSVAGPAKAEPKLDGELGMAASSWDACEGANSRGRYFLGRFAHNIGVVEVKSTNAAAVAKLWARAKPGGVSVDWPGGRTGVRHLEGKNLADATPVASAGRLYVWEGTNGWGNNLAQITGVELAKSLCDASTLVVYITLKVDLPGEGYLIASVNPPETAVDALPILADPSKQAMGKLYSQLLDRLETGLRSQKQVPAQVTLSVLPGHFMGEALEYAVSVKWANTFDDRYSTVCLADASGNITQVLDKQEGAAGGIAVEVADLGDGKSQDLIYELTTLEGTAAALWSFKDGKVVPVVQTTPVGE
jgi:hypothetical protein